MTKYMYKADPKIPTGVDPRNWALTKEAERLKKLNLYMIIVRRPSKADDTYWAVGKNHGAAIALVSSEIRNVVGAIWFESIRAEIIYPFKNVKCYD